MTTNTEGSKTDTVEVKSVSGDRLEELLHGPEAAQHSVVLWDVANSRSDVDALERLVHARSPRSSAFLASSASPSAFAQDDLPAARSSIAARASRAATATPPQHAWFLFVCRRGQARSPAAATLFAHAGPVPANVTVGYVRGGWEALYNVWPQLQD